MLTVVASLMFASATLADDTHEVDRGLEGTLRATLNERHVQVHVHKGIVTLDGRVTTQAERDRIDSLVRGTPGVVAVKDQLHVSLPSPAGVSTTTVIPSTIPVYTAPLPEVAPSVTVVNPPAPVIIPHYPKVKVQAWSTDDEPTASRIARQLEADAIPSTGLENVTIIVRNGNVSLKGLVDSHEDRDDLIASLQKSGGFDAIYDQLQIK
jgi:osmotically-inducible protein OsmY